MADLWSFSLALYGRPGVAPACLRCQDEAGADVNLVLFLLWQARVGVRFAADEVAAIDRNVQPWRDQVVQPLRAVRPYLMGRDADGLRQTVKAAEQDAERLEQDALSRHARPIARAPTAEEAARGNLDAYEAALGRKLPPAAVTALLTTFARDGSGDDE
jgi:uncharacterized protein (TIGR02444 family)